MKSNVENKLKEEFNKGFETVRRTGLLQGATAISKVVLDKANDTSKTPEERLADIIQFCEVSLHSKK